jgi:hypothetical protein
MNSSEVRQIINEANRKFGPAASKDYAGMVAFYTEGAKLLLARCADGFREEGGGDARAQIPPSHMTPP